MPLVDGLGGEELGQAGSQVSSLWMTGSIVSESTISGASVHGTGDVTAGADVTAAGDLSIGSSAVFPFTLNEGVIINNVPSESIITGGMWVEISGASGTSPSFICKASKEPQCAGICLANCASGSNPSILTRGPYHGVVAEASVSVGDGVAVGAGAGLNCVKATGAGLNRGTVIMGGGSEATVAVWLH